MLPVRWSLLCALSCLGFFTACSDDGGEGDGAGGATQTGGTSGTGGGGTAGVGGAGGMSGAGGTVGTGGSSAGAGGMGGSVQTGGTGGSMTGGAGGGTASALMVESTAFVDGMMISADYRCQNPSPPLSWSGGPAGTMSYAITLVDQTPGIAQGYLHWVIYDIPAGTTTLSEGVPIGYMPATPAGAKQAPIWNDTLGYNGPCAPFGTNTYELTLHAIDVATLPGLSMSSSGAEVVAQIEAHSLQSDVITVTSAP